jgi:phage replication O-like protein O
MCASPQVENGFTRIANELMVAISSTKLTAYEYKMLLFILRNIYGWRGRKEWTINKWKEFEKIGIAKSHIKRTLLMLCDRGLITVSGKTIKFNKDYDQWKEIEKNKYFPDQKVTSSDKSKLPHQVTKKLPHQVTQVTSSGNSKAQGPLSSLTLPAPKAILKKVHKENTHNNGSVLVHSKKRAKVVGSFLNPVKNEEPESEPKSRKDIHGFPSYEVFFTWLESQSLDKQVTFKKKLTPIELKLYGEWRP